MLKIDKEMALPTSCTKCLFIQAHSLDCQYYDSEFSCPFIDQYPLGMHRVSYPATPEEVYEPEWLPNKRHPKCPLGEYKPDEITENIVKNIYSDVTDRRGIKQEFYKCDDEVIQEIKHSWSEIIKKEL